jgi:hypothetical protein
MVCPILFRLSSCKFTVTNIGGMKGRGYSEDLDEDGRMILNWMSEK